MYFRPIHCVFSMSARKRLSSLLAGTRCCSPSFEDYQRDTFGASPSLKGIFDAISLRDMASRIGTCGVVSGEIDRDEETRLGITVNPVLTPTWSITAEKDRPTTGATDYAGSYIMQ